MLASTPNHSDYISVRSRARDQSMSPSCRLPLRCDTPPRPTTGQRPTSYDSPMLTPSPLRKRSLFTHDHSAPADNDDGDIFLQSPYRSPSLIFYSHLAKPVHSQLGDNEGGTFLSSAAQQQHFSSSSSQLPTSTSQPLRTPVKQVHRTPSYTYMSKTHLNPQPRHTYITKSAPAFVGGGTKRKSTPLGGSGDADFSTPPRQRFMTPLGISSAQNADSASGGIVFDRLAPLPAPRFTARTPQSKIETEVHLKKHTESMTRLRICDLDGEGGDALFSRPTRTVDGNATKVYAKGKGKPSSLGHGLESSLLAIAKGKGKDEEVIEAISPGGHIIKRRARSRPVSQELLGSVNYPPSPSPSQIDMNSTRAMSNRSVDPILFPSLTEIRSRAASYSPASPSSPSEASSPLSQSRLISTSNVQTNPRLQTSSTHEIQADIPVRAPMNRLTSSATLFFGPAIPSPTSIRSRSSSRPRISKISSPSSKQAAALPVDDTNVTTRRRSRPGMVNRRSLTNRHSYAGPGSARRYPSPVLGHGFRGTGSQSPSPGSSPRAIYLSDDNETQASDDDDMFFDGPKDSSFVFSVTEGTPSPRKESGAGVLRKKYKPRDSGVVMTDDEGIGMSMGMGGTIGASSSLGGLARGDNLSVMPRASTSVNSVYSDIDQELVTPGFGPCTDSGWPDAVIVRGSGFDDVTYSGEGVIRGVGSGGGSDDADVDAFILRTLAAATKGPKERRGSEGGYGMKKMPGTPVKKVKTSHNLVGDRPWQSAVAAKVGFGFGFGLDADVTKAKAGGPRKSMPAVYPCKSGGDTDSEGEEDSPSSRKEARYVGLGLGKPRGGAFSGTKWLIRRSSSSIFSSGNDTSGTPTAPREWNAPPSRIPTHHSPAKPTATYERSISGSSSSSAATLNSPLARRHLPASGITHRRPHAPTVEQQPLEPKMTEEQQPGRFEQDFVEDDEVGSGEFGKVMKVRYKNGREGEVFAVKKSKRFEGVRHRLRLREEVDILQHLSQVAAETEGGQHPNVLAYVDSWEQDEALYIQTELCELGNFALFLGEFGRKYPRLDEARVWKIFVDLSNGLEFIHESGVIHLDLKPANIFITVEGRFKIGDFGMASLWPRPNHKAVGSFEGDGAFEREGDKVYLAPEVLQGNYGKAADIFSFGITMLETASNIVVPDQGDAWHQLRQENFPPQVGLDDSPELLDLIKSMMRRDPALRVSVQVIRAHPVVSRARAAMEQTLADATKIGSTIFAASPLASVPKTFLENILGHAAVPTPDDGAMDLSL